MRHQRYFRYLVILLTVLYPLSSICLSNRNGCKQQPGCASSPRDDYLRNAVIKKINAEGHLHSSLYVDRLTYSKTLNKNLLMRPRINVIDNKNCHWTLSALYGETKPGSDRVLLSQQVILKTNRSSYCHHPIRLDTSQMTVYFKKAYATTQKTVRIKRPHSHIQAKGLQANLKTGQITLTGPTEYYETLTR